MSYTERRNRQEQEAGAVTYPYMFHSCERSNEYGERGASIYIAHTARGPSPLTSSGVEVREGERESFGAQEAEGAKESSSLTILTLATWRYLEM